MSSSTDDYCGSQVSIEIGETIISTGDQHHGQQDVSISPGPEGGGGGVLEKIDHQQSEYSSSTLREPASVDDGKSGDHILNCRQKAFGFNQQDQANSYGHLHLHNHSMVMEVKKLVVQSFKDGTIILLIICASLSLLIDVLRSGPHAAFVDGTIIFLSIFFVATFGNIFRFLKTRWMLKRSLQQHNRKEHFARVMREDGKTKQIPASQIMAGDVVFLETGDLVPADGSFLDGTDSCKIDFQSCHANSTTVSMFSGAKVADGSCRMRVTSVGENTERSKLVGSLMRADRGKQHPEESKFQNGIHRTTSLLEKILLSLTLFILIVQVFRCVLRKSTGDNPDPKGVKNLVEELMNESMRIAKKQGGKSTNNGLVRVLCVLVFATRDGFPLGLFVLSFVASRKMKSLGEPIVLKLSACATLGLVTTLCLSRSDDLTLTHTKMGELWVGFNLIQNVSEELSSQVLGKLKVGLLCRNSSGCEMEDSLLLWAQKAIHHQADNDEMMSRYCTIQQSGSVEVDKDRSSLLVLRRIEGGKDVMEMHWKGDLERIISQCSHYYDADGTMQTLDEEKRSKFNRLVSTRDYIKGFAFAYKKVEKEEESSSTKLEEEEESHDHNGEDDVSNEKSTLVKLEVDDRDHGWILIGFVLLKNPIFPPEVKQAIQECEDLGVNVKLMVEDDAKTARMMALSCGILNPDEQGGISEFAVMEGSAFREYSEEGRMKIIDEVKAIANATPDDKLLMVQCLKKKGEEVAITTGSCIRDLPSLVEADVGIFFLGCNTSTNAVPEMAKEDADIIFTRPTNTGEIAKIIRFGRYVCQSIEMFLELHMILNFSAVTLNLTSEVWKSEAKLSSAQLLWTNLVVEALGALAVGMMLPMGPSKHQRYHPVLQPITDDGVGPALVITKKMWRNAVIQTLSQVTILLVIGMKAKDVVHVADDGFLKTMIFNSYILCQIFVLIGGIKMKKEISKESPPLTKISTENLLFLSVVGMILALQILMIEIMGVVADHWGNLDLKTWSVCFGIAGLSALPGWAANWLISRCRW